jgi:hypothetical protein
MAIRITAVRLEGGNAHEHIVRLWWVNPANSQTGTTLALSSFPGSRPRTARRTWRTPAETALTWVS